MNPLAAPVLLGAIVLALLLPGWALAQVNPAQTIPIGPGTIWTTSSPLDRTIGWEFMTLQAREVLALGVYDRGSPAPEPGLGDMHEAGLWESAGTLLAMTTVPAGVGGAQVGDFRYANISPVMLNEFSFYKVAALWPSALFDHYPDLDQSGIVPTYHPEVSPQQSCQAFGSTLMFPNVNSGTLFLAGAVNFLLNDASPPVPIGNSYCDPAVPNSTGLPGRIHAFGSTVISDDNLTVVASDLPVSEFGYFLASQAAGVSVPPGSSGRICVTGNIGYYTQLTSIIQGPMGSLHVDLTAIPVMPPHAVAPGEFWYFQCWYRDANPGQTSNFTDAVSVVFQ